MACRFLRGIRSIGLWVELHYVFWLTSAFLLMSFLCFFVPWMWLIQWTCRIFVWALLGPWMKLVDKFWFVEEDLDKEKTEEFLREKLN